MRKLSTTKSALFISGIHMDMLGRLDAPALIGSSNPGTFTSMPGGASLNSASVAALLGLDCTMIGFIGDDRHGETLAQTLNDRQLNNRLHICEQRTTGTYTSIIEPDGNLHIAIADLGLNEEMTADWLRQNRSEELKLSDIWFLNANLSTSTLEHLTSPQFPYRPQILAAASISPSKSRHLAPSLESVDVLFTNIAEASAMLNHRAGNSYDAPHLNAQACIDQLRLIGVDRGSMSQGSDLLWVWEGGEIRNFVPQQVNTITDVTGAGDALAGTFLAGLGASKSMFEIAPLAIAAAQMTLLVTGPYNHDINLRQLQQNGGCE